MKTLAIAAFLATVSVGAYANSDAGTGAPMPPKNGMPELTDEQRSCIEQYGCQMPEQNLRPEKPNNDERPTPPDGGAPDKHDDMDCMRRAMDACGVHMPTPPESEPPVRQNV